jgi:hypothetical protein
MISKGRDFFIRLLHGFGLWKPEDSIGMQIQKILFVKTN